MEQLRHENGLLNGIIRFSLNNRMVVLVIAALCLVAGIYSTTHTEVDVFPDLNAPTVVVMTEAEGMAPEEVERLVTFPIETAVNGATNVRRVRSSSATGFSIVNIEFDWGTDIYKARQIVSEKIAMIGDDLPENVGKPTLGPQASILGELMIIGLTADTTSMQDLRTIADWTIRPRLLSTGGVAQVAVMGGDIKEYQILMDPGRMRRFGVSMDEVIYAVKGMNQNASGGTLYEYGNEYIVRGLLSTNDLDEMKKAVVKTSENGLPITLDAVADVRIGPKTPVLGVASNDGKPAVLLTVTKPGGILENKVVYQIVDKLVSLFRSIPFIILLTWVMPICRCQGQLPDIPPVPLHRKLVGQREAVLDRRSDLRDHRAVHIPYELANHRDFAGLHTAFDCSVTSRHTLDGTHYQHDEPRRNRHRHRLACG